VHEAYGEGVISARHAALGWNNLAMWLAVCCRFPDGFLGHLGFPFNRFMRFAGVKHDILEDDNVRQITISPNFTYGFTRVFTGSLTGSPISLASVRGAPNNIT
jgi:hypothetical protein